MSVSYGSGLSPVQCIEVMKQGSSMLKCTKRGKRHFRHFQISQDMKKLTWKSPKKDTTETAVVLSLVKGVLVGQRTAIFKKNKLPEYEHISFSVLYGDKTLDVICKDSREYDIWVVGLRALTVEPVSLEANAYEPSSPSLSSSLETLEISFKGSQTVVIKKEDTVDVYSFGKGQNGRLGHGDEVDVLQPKVVEGLLGKEVVQISCGTSHSAALTLHGEVYTWGAGDGGRLGHGMERDRMTPLLISALRGHRVLHVSCGDTHTAVVTDFGFVYTWGRGDDGRLGIGDTAPQLAPRQVQELDRFKITYVSCGAYTTGAVSAEGSVFMWGGNEKGQLGLGDTKSRSTPCEVTNLAGQNVLMIGCGQWHTVSLSKTGEVFSWGDGMNGKLGQGPDIDSALVPGQVTKAPSNITEIAVGDFHNACITQSGDVYTWGEGNYGQLGHGAAVTQYSTPLQVGKLNKIKITKLACGANHTAVITEKGEVYAWGYGASGRLGHGNEEQKEEPVRVETFVGKQVVGIACGSCHTAVCVTHGLIRCVLKFCDGTDPPPYVRETNNQQWVPDQEATQCMNCKAGFTTIRRRHHCRKCGGLFCGACTTKRIPLLAAGLPDPVRVCDKCYNSLSSKKK